jgi:hypothetical protein
LTRRCRRSWTNSLPQEKYTGEFAVSGRSFRPNEMRGTLPLTTDDLLS